MTIKPNERANANEDIVFLSTDDNQLTNTQDLKILGVNMDDKFNFHKHITLVCRKSSQKVGVAILPHLSYCHLVGHFCRASDKRKLERVQERALRAVFNSNSLTYQEPLRKANLPSPHTIGGCKI